MKLTFMQFFYKTNKKLYIFLSWQKNTLLFSYQQNLKHLNLKKFKKYYIEMLLESGLIKK